MTRTLVFVEGLIGAGKSTVLEAFRRSGATVIQEPVNEWTYHLGALYSGAVGWPQCMQSLALSTFAERLLSSIAAHDEGSLIVAERSLESSRIFANETLDVSELETYDRMASVYKSALEAEMIERGLKATHVYLRVRPDLALERIAIRNRPQEMGIDPGYIQRLFEAHERVFAQAPTVDASGTPDEVAQAAIQVINGCAN